MPLPAGFAGCPSTYRTVNLQPRLPSRPAQIVVAAALVRDGRVLLCHRSPLRRWYPDVWDFPGGHAEPGESPREALAREVHEELGIVIDPTALPVVADAHLQLPEVDMSLWKVLRWTGNPTNKQCEEHDEIAWFDLTAAVKARLADPAYPTLLRNLLG